MLKMINSNERVHLQDMYNKYFGCRFLLVDLDISDMSDITGILYCVSDSIDTYNDLVNENYKYKEKNNNSLTMIAGFYDEGSVFNV